jgi:hypothetical protein
MEIEEMKMEFGGEDERDVPGAFLEHAIVVSFC